MGDFRIRLKDKNVYFSLKDMTLQTTVYKRYLKGKKLIKNLDRYTGFKDKYNRKIFTNDIIECHYKDEDKIKEKFRYLVKYGACLKEDMYGIKFKGFFIKELNTGNCYSLLDEIKNNEHSDFRIVKRKLVKKSQKAKIKQKVSKKINKFKKLIKKFIKNKNKKLKTKIKKIKKSMKILKSKR